MTHKRPSHAPLRKVSRGFQRKVSAFLLSAMLLTQGPAALLAAEGAAAPSAGAPAPSAPTRAAGPARQSEGRAVQETQSERDARVEHIRVEPEGATVLVGQRLPLGATAFDGKGVPVGGVLFTRSLTGGPEGQAEVSPGGVFVARAPGEYEVTVEGAAHVAAVKITAVSKKSNLQRAATQPGAEAIEEEVDGRYVWNEENFWAARRPENQRGTRAEHPPAVNGNFTFSVPLLSLPGRGLGLNLGLTYNSRVWTVAQNSSGGRNVTYDMDSDWPAPGWSFSLPRLAVLGSGGAMLIEGDGTRHPFTGTTTNTQGQTDYRFEGYTTDGSFIRYRTLGGGGAVQYPDGTTVGFEGRLNSTGVGMLSRPPSRTCTATPLASTGIARSARAAGSPPSSTRSAAASSSTTTAAGC
jgi:hypothetical protein